jgi:sugar O-acyltransferase (sialic acid O-acetyltransferase NeuD family)
MRIVLLGGGVHLQYSIDVIQKQNKFEIAGITDSIKAVGQELFGYKVIGRQEEIKELVSSHGIEAGLITVGDNWTRKAIYDAVTSRIPGFKFVSAIHPSVIIGNNVEIGSGVIAMAGVIFNPGARIGDFTLFGTGAQIEHDCVIEEFASVSSGSVLGGFVRIAKYAAVCLGATILDRVSIGENTVVGSGSLVTRSLPASVLAYGAPAKIVRNRQAGERFLK